MNPTLLFWLALGMLVAASTRATALFTAPADDPTPPLCDLVRAKLGPGAEGRLCTSTWCNPYTLLGAACASGWCRAPGQDAVLGYCRGDTII